MGRFLKYFCENLFLSLMFPNFGMIFVVIFTCKIVGTQAFPSGVHVDGYRESEVPTYPFQQYIQVRKTYTVEHVPVYEQGPSNLYASASNNHHGGSSKDHQTASTQHNSGEHDGGGGNHYHVPRLREEVHDYKKQEVYEEKGYGDSDYDHYSYKEPSKHHHYNDHDGEGTSGHSVADGTSLSKHVHGNSNYRRKSRKSPSRYYSLHTPDGSSTKLLEYVASNLHDGDAQRKGIYAARSNIYCPEVIDFDLGSKRMGMGKSGDRGAKPRLRGLGSKISCLKNKYFGSEPLPKAIFAEPSVAAESVIETPSFNNFFKMVKNDVGYMSSFQNSNVPI